jgi:hypothetical protein
MGSRCYLKKFSRGKWHLSTWQAPSTTSPSSTGYNSLTVTVSNTSNCINVLTQANLHSSLIHNYEHNAYCYLQTCQQVHTELWNAPHSNIIVTYGQCKILWELFSQPFITDWCNFHCHTPPSPSIKFRVYSIYRNTVKRTRYPMLNILKLKQTFWGHQSAWLSYWGGGSWNLLQFVLVEHKMDGSWESW